MIALPQRRLLLVVLTMLAVAAALALAGAPSAHAASYKKCSLTEKEQQPTGENPKPTYNFTLERKGTSCTTAKKVMRAFHKCRDRDSFRCTSKLLSRWTCTGRKSSSIPTELNASFTCKSGTRRVRSSYQQRLA